MSNLCFIHSNLLDAIVQKTNRPLVFHFHQIKFSDLLFFNCGSLFVLSIFAIFVDP